MDSQQDGYFDEETGEVMSPKENNMAATDSAADEITNQNSVDKNGNSATNSVVKTTTVSSDKSKVSLDLNVNNVAVVNDVNTATVVSEAPDSPRSAEDKVSPVDSGRHFRVTKSSQPKGVCGDNVKPRVSFDPSVCMKGNVAPRQGDTSCADSDREGPPMETDHCEQTTSRSPNIIHVSDPDYSEDVLIQYGVDPYRWMYPKDLSRPEKPNSPVPATHNDNDLTDSELLTQFCSGKGAVFSNSQAKPRRGNSSSDATTDEAMRLGPRGNPDPCPTQPRKVIATENERFRVPPNLKKTGDTSCEKTRCDLPPKRDMNNLPGRRAGMMRMESGESETGETKGRRNLEEVELNANPTGGAAGWSMSKEDLEKQYAEYVKTIGDSGDEIVQTDDAPAAEENMKCMCPQCGHEMNMYETPDKSPKDRQLVQDKENVCHCDHSDKGPDWHAMFMFKWFKMHSFMMNRGRFPFPSHSPNQGAQRPPFASPPWVRPWVWRPGCPMAYGNQTTGPAAGATGSTAPGVQGPCRQRFRAPWSGDCPHGTDKPKDVQGAGAC